MKPSRTSALRLLGCRGGTRVASCVTLALTNMMTSTPITLVAILWAMHCGAQTNIISPCLLLNQESQRLNRILNSMGESEMPHLTNNIPFECYRFLRWSAWGSPVSVCLTKTGDVFSVRTTTSRLIRRTLAESPYETTQSLMSPSESEEVQRLLISVDLFNMSPTERYAGCDGSDWFLEGISGGVYRVVTRWEPDTPRAQERGLEAFVALGKRLLDYSNMHIANKASQAIGASAPLPGR